MLIVPGGPLFFPDPEATDEEGLVAVGGDLSVERLRLAYESGIFPWYDVGLPPLWWSPDPRAIVDPGSLHVSRSMRRVLGSRRFELRRNTLFETVMMECGRGRSGGTWILPEMVDAYRALHERGDAHSFEVFLEGRLVGGLYGVQRGGLFAAESMFHRETNASKVALIGAVNACFSAGIELFDVQFLTEHLASMGAFEISRHEYLSRLAAAVRRRADLTTS
ncbi:MAG: leucyl/phenylalanyl-tRNA--protein transferase [Myxococcales bacterium]|nr:leucyl/phenylalanyl-tRNA--protein transferase [Myxococcales bacterium]MCB9581930.1 leucyl/phenylalanyl-tRNA--protein transferase [Polyangiaceae bacterium]